MGRIFPWLPLRKQQIDTMNRTAFPTRTARAKPHEEFSHFCGYSVLYTDDVPAERMVVVASQTVVNICDVERSLAAKTLETTLNSSSSVTHCYS